MDIKYALGVVVAFSIGAGCRWFGVAVPAPPTLAGVFLIFAITAGYMAADAYLGK